MTRDVVETVKAWRNAKHTLGRGKVYLAVVELWDVIGYVEPKVDTWKVPTPQATRRIVTVVASAVKNHSEPQCVRCHAVVNPGFCYAGKVMESFIKIPVEKAVFRPEVPESTTEIHPVVVGKYVRGFICDECASDYTTVEHPKTGARMQVVITERLHPMADRKPVPEREGFRSNKGFNTRVTR